MMKYGLAIGLVFCVLFSYVSAKETDAERAGFRGKVKFVERYETYFCCTPNQRRRLPRKLTGTTTFNKKGGYVEWVSINNTSDGPYYTRRVFKYDERGRKIGAEEYRSDKNPPETYFELVRGPDGSVKVMPERAERLVERTSYTLDAKGRIVEVISRDQNENLNFHHVYKFDDDGKTISSASLVEGGRVRSESATVYFGKGERAETLGFDSQGKVYRNMVWYDREGRVMYGERYTLQTEASGKGARYLPQNISRFAYNGEGGRTVDFIHYGGSGAPETKTVSTYSRRDELLSRVEFKAGPLPAGSQNEGIEPAWTMRERTQYRREYDRKGNALRTEIREQSGPELPVELTNIYESVITYY